MRKGKEIVQVGKEVIYPSISEAARVLGVSRQAISASINHRRVSAINGMRFTTMAHIEKILRHQGYIKAK